MGEGLTWIAENANSASIFVYLLLTLLISGYGLHRRWWVIGWIYTDCLTSRDEVERERDELRDKAEQRAERIELKLDLLETVERERAAIIPRPRRSP